MFRVSSPVVLCAAGWGLASPQRTRCLLRRGIASQQVVCGVGKGFGKSQRSSVSAEEDGKRPKQRKIKQSPQAIPQQQKLSLQALQETTGVKPFDQEEEDFNKRLQSLKAQSEQAAKQLADSKTSVLSTGASQNVVTDNIYENPPTVTDTLLSQLNSDVADPKMKNAQFGPGQLFLAGGAVVFGLVFLLSTGGDFAVSNRFSNVRPAQTSLDPIQEGIYKSRAAQLELMLRETPNNPENLQELALTYAKLFEYEKAASPLDQLVAMQPNNAQAWRLLGETALLNQQSARAVKAYERAAALQTYDAVVLSGLAEAFISNGQQRDAITFFKTAKDNLPSPASGQTTFTAAAPQVPTPAELTELSSATGEPITATVIPSTEPPPQPSSSGTISTSSTPPPSVDAISLDLLTAKVYASWRGHDADAAAVYDSIIKYAPEDYRGYLAKGVFLRDKGRRADAERMFIQAKFYAPSSKQGVVARMAQDPVLPGAVGQ